MKNQQVELNFRKELYTKSVYNSKLTNDLIEVYTNTDTFLIAKREGLSKFAQYAHPMVKDRPWVVDEACKKLHEYHEKYQLIYPHIDIMEIRLLICKGEIDPPYEDELNEVFYEGLRYIAYGRVDYWNPSIDELKRVDEAILLAYRDHYQKLYERS